MVREVKSYYFSFPRNFLVELKTSGSVEPGEMLVLANTYLPGVVQEVSPSRASDMVVEQVESDVRDLQIGRHEIKIFDRWENKISLDIWHLLYSVVRAKYLALDLYPVHSACVGKDQYVLLVGHSGAGKTSVLLRLVSDFGSSIYSGNKTVVEIESGKIKAEAGTINQWEDVALVMMHDGRGQISIARSISLSFPLNTVQKARVRGYKKYTVGSVLAEEAADHSFEADPHSFITMGKETRLNVLEEAITQCYLGLH